MQRNDSTTDAPSPISRLTAAFAKMLGAPARAGDAEPDASADAPPPPGGVTPRGIVEAMLFVGRPGDEAITAAEIAAAMRDVTADEVAEAVDDLNAIYERDEAPYRIEATPSGYRMTLDGRFAVIHQGFAGSTRPARLSQATLEVLSVVAYEQPIRGADIDAVRGKRSGPALAQLVRRQLVRRDEDASGGGPSYRTTDRFLQLFDLANPDQLPRVAELDD